jgi:hypothetical protein
MHAKLGGPNVLRFGNRLRAALFHDSYDIARRPPFQKRGLDLFIITISIVITFDCRLEHSEIPTIDCRLVNNEIPTSDKHCLRETFCKYIFQNDTIMQTTNNV